MSEAQLCGEKKSLVSVQLRRHCCRSICRRRPPRSAGANASRGPTMQQLVPPVSAARPVWLVILASGLIVGTAMGLRQVMGLFLTPMTTELAIGREPFSLAMAIANLVWGLAAMPMGYVAD